MASLTLLFVDVDPGRSIKKDLFQLCQSFESIELHFSTLLAKLDAPAEPPAAGTEASPPSGEHSDPTGEQEGQPKDLSNPEEKESGSEGKQSDPKVDQDISSEDQRAAPEREQSEPIVSCRTENISSDSSASSECIVSDDPTPGRGQGKSISEGSKVEVESISWESKVEVRLDHDDKPAICDKLSDNVPVENVSVADRNVVSEASLDLTSKDESFGHYEECSVSSTITFVRPKAEITATKVEKVEAFITMPITSGQNCVEPRREVSELEQNLGKCEDLLHTALYLQDSSIMEDDLRCINQHLALLADAFVPANLTEDESSVVLDQLLEVKNGLREREKAVKCLLEDLNQGSEFKSNYIFYIFCKKAQKKEN